MDSACSKNDMERDAYKILMGNPEGKRRLRNKRRGWVHNI
jgi:hypothetical protein